MPKRLMRDLLPKSVLAPLWGDREKWGLVAKKQDLCWREWQRTYVDFYQNTQTAGIGALVNRAGYKIISLLDLAEKTVLEIGPGDIRHMPFWIHRPTRYILVDIEQAMLDMAIRKLKKMKIETRFMHMQHGQALPLADASVDIIISFYSLEHIYPLPPYLKEISRILKPGGVLTGAIPTEGGLAWGSGRFLTSRRWLQKNTTINPDKIICWEHPNFCDHILAEMDHHFFRSRIQFWPLPWLPNPDLNLVIRFIYTKKE